MDPKNKKKSHRTSSPPLPAPKPVKNDALEAITAKATEKAASPQKGKNADFWKSDFWKVGEKAKKFELGAGTIARPSWQRIKSRILALRIFQGRSTRSLALTGLALAFFGSLPAAFLMNMAPEQAAELPGKIDGRDASVRDAVHQPPEAGVGTVFTRGAVFGKSGGLSPLKSKGSSAMVRAPKGAAKASAGSGSLFGSFKARGRDQKKDPLEGRAVKGNSGAPSSGKSHWKDVLARAKTKAKSAINKISSGARRASASVGGSGRRIKGLLSGLNKTGGSSSVRAASMISMSAGAKAAATPRVSPPRSDRSLRPVIQGSLGLSANSMAARVNQGMRSMATKGDSSTKGIAMSAAANKRSQMFQSGNRGSANAGLGTLGIATGGAASLGKGAGTGEADKESKMNDGETIIKQKELPESLAQFAAKDTLRLKNDLKRIEAQENILLAENNQEIDGNAPASSGIDPNLTAAQSVVSLAYSQQSEAQVFKENVTRPLLTELSSKLPDLQTDLEAARNLAVTLDGELATQQAQAQGTPLADAIGAARLSISGEGTGIIADLNSAEKDLVSGLQAASALPTNCTVFDSDPVQAGASRFAGGLDRFIRAGVTARDGAASLPAQLADAAEQGGSGSQIAQEAGASITRALNEIAQTHVGTADIDLLSNGGGNQGGLNQRHPVYPSALEGFQNVLNSRIRIQEQQTYINNIGQVNSNLTSAQAAANDTASQLATIAGQDSDPRRPLAQAMLSSVNAFNANCRVADALFQSAEESLTIANANTAAPAP